MKMKQLIFINVCLTGSDFVQCHMFTLYYAITISPMRKQSGVIGIVIKSTTAHCICRKYK